MCLKITWARGEQSFLFSKVATQCPVWPEHQGSAPSPGEPREGSRAEVRKCWWLEVAASLWWLGLELGMPQQPQHRSFPLDSACQQVTATTGCVTDIQHYVQTPCVPQLLWSCGLLMPAGSIPAAVTAFICFVPLLV